MTQNVSGTKTFLAGAAVTSKALVQLSSGTVIVNTATATHDPIGVAQFAAATGAPVTVRLLTHSLTMEMVAAGAITAGADVYAAAAGKVQALPAAAATYRKIGIALEAAASDGQVIEVLPYDFHATTVVSE